MLSILLSGLFLIGLLVVITSMIVPEFQHVSDRRALLYSNQTALRNQTKAVNDVEGLIKEFQGFAQARETVTLALPISQDIPYVLWQVGTLAQTAGVSLKSFDNSPEPFITPKEPLAQRLGVMDVTIVVQGTYDNMKQFVKYLETNVRVFNVQNFDITPTGSTVNGEPTYQLAVEFNAYFQE